MEKKKLDFIKNFRAAGGIVAAACEATKICRQTYYDWCSRDQEFYDECHDIIEEQIDFVESKLLSNIKKGDTTSTIFYLKTKAKHRGYNEKVVTDIAKSAQQQADEREQSKKIKKAVATKRQYITKLLKKCGKYTEELTYQVEITASLLVRLSVIGEELAQRPSSVSVERNKEGFERTTKDPLLALYLDISQQAQRSLQALGMNCDAKEKQVGTGEDVYSRFDFEK